MIRPLFLRDDGLGRRVGDGIGISADDIRQLKPLATQGCGLAAPGRRRTARASATIGR